MEANLKAKLTKIFIEGGIRPSDDPSKARAIKISNMITLSAIGNTLLFTLIFYYSGDNFISKILLLTNLLYTLSYLITITGRPTLGRIMMFVFGFIAIFYVANIFRGQSFVQVILLSVSASTFMFFGWSEKHISIVLAPLSIILLVVGEFNHWSFFEAYTHDYDLTYVRLVSIFATSHQIITGYYYFFKQSAMYEMKLIEEHQHQIQVQKMSSLGEMASGVSHEINNPLAVILGKSSMLRRELVKKLAPDDSSLQFLDKIDEMSFRISNITKSLINFSRNSTKDAKQRVEVRNIIEETLHLCQERFRLHGIQIQIECDPDLYMECRPSEMSQVLLNLLNNSFDAVISQADRSIWISAQKKNDHVTIRVQDSGNGVDPVIVNKIMDPFFTTKEVGKGTGLGLSISRGLVRTHGGELSYLFDTRPTFQIEIPTIN
jgi:signal transduction histidine kinase